MIRVLIADDHPVVRTGLKQILETNREMVCSAEADNGHQVLDILRKKGMDVVVLDLSMPGLDGLDTLKRIKSLYPHLPVLVLSVHPEEHYAVRVLRAGGAGYMTKGSATGDLTDAIRKVYGGGRWVPPAVAEKLVDELTLESGKMPHETLSDREFQVLLMLASGKTVGEIGEELALSVKTISTYRTRLLEKMNLRNNAELMQYAFQNNLLD